MSYVRKLFRVKTADSDSRHPNLIRCLTSVDLTLMGIGAIVGAGIFVLTGIAAATKAGPAIVLSYALAALACGFTAMAYAELAAAIGGCGSAYSYAYRGIGEFIAWVIGWDLLLEYGLASSAVAIGWSGYMSDILHVLGIDLPNYLRHGIFNGGFCDLPAMMIVAFVSIILALGVKHGARLNLIMVIGKLLVIGLFIVVASGSFNIKNWHPFLPFGWQGIADGASLIFFAYIGFDAISTAGEEAINPQRDMPIGIIASLLICTILYMVVSGLLTGAVPYTQLNVPSPVANALIILNHNLLAGFIAVGAVAGLTTVILVMLYGFTRIFLAMARDGLFPAYLAELHPKTKTPTRIILTVGVIMTLLAGFAPIHRIAELINIGTLAAFTVVCIGTIVLRYTQPDLPRSFKAPGGIVSPIIGALLCLFLMASLPLFTWCGFFIWTAIGLIIYFGYSQFHSNLAKYPS